MSINISYYPTVKKTDSKLTIPFDLFLEDIKSGKWQDFMFGYNSGKIQKSMIPAVTISGIFSERRITGLLQHSGLICIDIDNVQDPTELKSILCVDPYICAAWVSVSGKGLALAFKITAKRHQDAFLGIAEYLFNNYGIVVDPSGKDVCRARFVSYDPDIYINLASKHFAIYPKPKPKGLRKLPKTIFVRSDFDEVINQITTRHINLLEDYQMWLGVGFAFAEKFGEGGREYFHRVSRPSSKYDSDKCDRQYSACLKNAKGHGYTMATFYWLCKQAGLQTMSKQTKLIASTAGRAKKGGRTQADTVKLIKDVEDISADKSADIIKQVFENDIFIHDSEDNLIEELEDWLRQEFDIKLNVITRKVEQNGEPMENKEFNSLYIQARRIFGTKVSFDLLERMIFSDLTPEYNPLLEWVEKNKHINTEGNFEKLCKTIITDMPERYVGLFILKWMVGIMESIHGESSPLMLVLAGDVQGTGKTEWMRRLLPREIRQYYAESKLDKDKDDEILMTQKLVIMDDEMAGKTKRDVARLKELTSKKWFSLREPYGRANVDLKRIAVLAGTSNEMGILNDPTGNRRILPIHVKDIDKDAYNEIDKTELFMEIYHIWQREGISSNLTGAEINYLNEQTENFKAVSIEAELISRYFTPGDGGFGSLFLTTTDIKVYIESATGQKLQLNKLGQELRNLGFVNTNSWVNGGSKKGYYVQEVQMANHTNNTQNTKTNDDIF